MDTQGQAVVTQDTGTLETMSVVESLVKLGQKQPADASEQPEIGADMPCIDADLSAAAPQVGPDMPDLLPPDQGVVSEETEDETTKARAGKRRPDGSPGGKTKKNKN